MRRLGLEAGLGATAALAMTAPMVRMEMINHQMKTMETLVATATVTTTKIGVYAVLEVATARGRCHLRSN